MDAVARARFKEACQDALEKIADAVERDARRFAPVDSGELRTSIRRDPVVGETVSIRATAEHAMYVENGTSRMDAQPYLKPALYRKRTL